MSRHLVFAVIAIIILSTTIQAEDTNSLKKTDETIAYLLDFVAKSDCTFIRNGQPYTGKQASAHMKSKYQYFKDEIKTPEDFIRLAATKSLQTGQLYMVKTKEGEESRCNEWIKKVLNECRIIQDNKEK